ncbi:MAG: aminotransferase class V-fold PLP-dependent enzyme, partial [bacterium]|nr:aminotransferase class V-fold PLP-dependent enzyme [bacterium]
TLREDLADIQGIELYGSEDMSRHVALLTCNVNGMNPVDAGAILDADFEIAVRVGLHCTPLVHKTLGSYPNGGIRFSVGPFNTMADIDRTVEAMSAIAQSNFF